jgi:glutathione peroxidase
MKKTLSLLLPVAFMLFHGALANGSNQVVASMDLMSPTFKDINGKKTSLAQFNGQIILIVNTASNCGFTVQYDGLEALYQKYKAQGFVVVGFPSNDFGGQEPGSNQEIKKFCDAKTGKYKINFPLMEKTVVQGSQKSELFVRLTSRTNFLGEINWNFEKFLINRSGQLVGRFKSQVLPDSLEIKKAIEAEL